MPDGDDTPASLHGQVEGVLADHADIGKANLGLDSAVVGGDAQDELLHPITGDGVKDLWQLGQHPDLLPLTDGPGGLELAPGFLEQNVKEVERLPVL